MDQGTRKKARSQTSNEPLAALVSVPSSKEAVASAVAGWQERWDDAFHDAVKTLIASHYPSDSKTLFDDVLAAFLFTEPEYCSSLLSPLIDALLSKRLSFSLRNAPFHSLQFAFTEAQAPGRGRTGRVFCNEILALLAPHAQAAGPCAWLTDSLADATPTLRELFFASFLQGGQPGRLRSLVAILEEERRRFRSVNLSHAMAPALLARLDKERAGTAALDEHAAFLQLYFSPAQNGAQHTFHTHKLVASLINAHGTAVSDGKQTNGVHANGSSAQSAPFMLWLIGFLASAQPPPSAWFMVHFLPPLLQGVQIGQLASSSILRDVLAHPLYSTFLLGASAPCIAALQAGKARDRGGEVSALLAACNAAGPTVGPRVLDLWQGIWPSTNTWADDWDRVHSLLTLYPSLGAELRTASVRLLSAFLACARRPLTGSVLASPADLTRKLFWYLLAEARPGIGDLFAVVMSHAAALPGPARKVLEQEAAECIASATVYELPHAVPYGLRAPVPAHASCRHMLLMLCRSVTGADASMPAVAVAVQAAPSLFSLLRTHDPETRHAAAQLLTALFSVTSSATTLRTPFFQHAHVHALLAALRDDFSFVADCALVLVQQLSAHEDFARTALPLAWALLLASSDAALALRLIGVLDSLASRWHTSVLADLLRRVDAQLFAAGVAANGTASSTGSVCAVSKPNTHMLMLLERLCRVDAIRTAPDMNRAVSGLGQYPEDVTLQQLKLLAACINPTLTPAPSSSVSDLLLHSCPALVRTLTSSNATLRELALLLLCWLADLTPQKDRSVTCAQLCGHIRSLAQYASSQDASLLLASASVLQARAS